MYTIPVCNGHRKPQVVPPQPAMLPEAACSVNLFFDVEGYGKAHATGRGLSADEAVANLTATIASTRQALAPRVSSREERLAQLLTCGLTKATAQGDWGLVARLSQAAALVLSGAVEPTERAQAMAVRSQNHADTWYTVEAGHCSCPDASKNVGRACKHKLAVALWERLSA